MDNLPRIIASLITEDPDLILESDNEIRELEREFLSDPGDEQLLIRLVAAYNRIGKYSENSIINDAIRHIDMNSKVIEDIQEITLSYLSKLPDNKLPEITIENILRNIKKPVNDPLTLLAISRNPQFSYFYATYSIRGRFELGEKAISEDPHYSYFYANYAIKGRFPLGEEAISKDPYYARYYARDILNGKWDGPFKNQAEETMNRNYDF